MSNSKETKPFRTSISFPPDMKQKLDIMSEKESRTFNSMVIKILNDYFQLMELTGLNEKTMSDYSLNTFLDAIKKNI